MYYNITIQKGNPFQLSNYSYIALANTIYKLFINILTNLLPDCGENIKKIITLFLFPYQTIVLYSKYETAIFDKSRFKYSLKCILKEDVLVYKFKL
jgi:hypothetical protein